MYSKSCFFQVTFAEQPPSTISYDSGPPSYHKGILQLDFYCETGSFIANAIFTLFSYCPLSSLPSVAAFLRSSNSLRTYCLHNISYCDLLQNWKKSINFSCDWRTFVYLFSFVICKQIRWKVNHGVPFIEMCENYSKKEYTSFFDK